MLVVTVVVLAVLWRWIDSLALTDVEKKAAAQLDEVKVAASIAVEAAGVFALYLAARRQRMAWRSSGRALGMPWWGRCE